MRTPEQSRDIMQRLTFPAAFLSLAGLVLCLVNGWQRPYTTILAVGVGSLLAVIVAYRKLELAAGLRAQAHSRRHDPRVPRR